MTPLSTPPPRGGRATIRDVAALAGVGIKTVSRVINDEPNVSPAMTERVRRAVEELEYLPDLAAGNLRRSGQRTQTIGLLVADVMDPFFAQIHRAVEDAAAVRGFAVFASSSDEDPAKERAAVQALLRRRVDGLVIACTDGSQAYLEPEQQRGTPIVYADRLPQHLVADAILTDNAGAAARATNHLIRHGHRRLAALVDHSTIWTARERAAGFRAATERAHIPPVDAPITFDIDDEESARSTVTALMRTSAPPTALFTARSVITIGAIRALRHLGLQHQVALIGFDDFEMADLLDPGVSVLAQRAGHIGRLAADRVFARLDGSAAGHETVGIPSDLIERGSGELRPS